MSTRIVVTLALVLGCHAPIPVVCEPADAVREARPPPPVWLDLEPGPHHVGYEQELRFDPSRAYTNPLAPLAQRPIVIARWYPADVSGKAMTVADYLEVGDSSTFGHLLEHHLREVFAIEVLSTFSVGFASPKQRQWLSAALAEPVLARLDATPRAGDWPVVLYHPGLGGSLTDNFVLFEYLASHGFVVISSAFVPPETTRFGIGWDPSTSIADLDFLARELHETTPLAVMGHSYGAQAALIWAMEGRRVDAVVSIDSTLENADPAAPWYRADEYARWVDRGNRIRVPSLLLASRYATDTSFVDSMTASDRHHAIVPVLDHNDFTSHGGVLRTLHGQEFRESEGSAAAFARAHEWEIQTIHAFLAGVLQGDSAQFERLDRDWAAGLAGASIVHRAALPPVDQARQLAILDAEGVEGILRLCEPANAPAICVSEQVLHELARVRRRAAQPDRAIALMREVITHYPKSAASHDLLGELLLEAGLAKAAVTEFERAVELAKASSDERVGYFELRAKMAKTIADN